MVATQAGGVVSIGSRRTRRERRTRKRRAQLGKSVSTMRRKSVFIVAGMLLTVIETVGRGIRWGSLWGLIVLVALLVCSAQKGRPLLAEAGRGALAVVMRVAAKGFGRDALLFVGLLGSGLAAMTYVMVGKALLAMLFCLLGVLLCVGLWMGDKIGGAE